MTESDGSHMTPDEFERWGYAVVDWIDLWFIPTFNVADSAIVTGAVLLAFGIKIAVAMVILFLAGFLGPLILAPVFFVTWAILARYGGLSDKQALGAVCVLVGLESIWLALGIS